MLVKRVQKSKSGGRRLALLLGVLILASNIAGETEIRFHNYQQWVQYQNIPVWVRDIIDEDRLQTNLEFSFHLNPCYLRGDFNGDGEADVAVMVKNTQDSTFGIAICHYGLGDVHVMGAGSDFGDGGTDFSWCHVWSVNRQEDALALMAPMTAPKLVGDALMLMSQAGGMAGGVIYWDGEQYRWSPAGC
jgi:hypothetical protein